MSQSCQIAGGMVWWVTSAPPGKSPSRPLRPGKTPRMRGQQSASHPKAQLLKADPGQGWFCQGHPHRKADPWSHIEDLSLATRWAKNHLTEGNTKKLVPFNLIFEKETPLFHTSAHAASDCPSFSYPLQNSYAFLRFSSNVPSSTPFSDQWCSHLTSLDFWPSPFWPLPGRPGCSHSCPLKPDFFLNVCLSPTSLPLGPYYLQQ